MKIKKYIANTLTEGKRHILAELGDDAVILSSRSVINPETGGEAVEIVAATDEKQDSGKVVEDKRSAIIQALTRKKAVNSGQTEQALQGDIKSEIESLKEMISDISESMKYRYKGFLNEGFAKLYKKLIDGGIIEKYALEVIARVSAYNHNAKYEDAFATARKIIVERLDTIRPLVKKDKRQVVLFVGHSGVGKTSSLVKIAVVNKILSKANILLVSADTYKVGGAEQLQTFASIVSMPYKSVYNPTELKDLLNKEKDRDFIFIDSSGKSYKDQEHLDELKAFIKVIPDAMIYLVESAAVNRKTFEKSLEIYDQFNLKGLILTKIDETEEIGSILPTLSRSDLPLAYVSSGQKIPEDLEPADRAKLSKLILPDEVE